MLLWKVRVGITENINSLTDLNQVTWLDNGFFCISNANIETLESYEKTIENKDDFPNEVMNVLGEDYYKSFSIPIPTTGSFTDLNIANVGIVWPSAIRGAPNTMEYLKQNPGSNIAIHYSSLNRLEAFSDSNIRHYIVNGDSLSLVTGIVNTLILNSIAFSSRTTLQQYIVRNYSPSIDMSKAEYALLNANLDTSDLSSKSFLGFTARFNVNSSYLNYLFGEYVPPDEITYPESPSNPLDPIPPSGPGTNIPGTFDDESDLIPDSSLPTLSSANTGFTRIYNPSLSQVQDLARYLWTDESVIQTIWNKIKQYFENPMDAIIGFNLVPVPVPNGGTTTFKLMYIDTGVSMTAAANQFVDRDCGTLKLEPHYGSALDHSPYTKISCFLPFIGTVQLNTDEVMGRTLHVKYRVDICSGSCVAKILVDGNCIYQYSGHCAIPIPISAADFSSYTSAAISVAKLAIGAAVSAGTGVPIAPGMDVGQQTNQTVTTTQTVDTARNPLTGRQVTTGTHTVTQTVEAPAGQSSTQASFNALSPANVSNTVGEIMGAKPHVEHSGSFSGNTGYLGVRRPFLIIERPNLCMPEGFQTMNGYPSMITMDLSTCAGYTRVQQVQLTGLSATNPEQAEILGLLKSGVIF